MGREREINPGPGQGACQGCGRPLGAGQGYGPGGRELCVDCAMDRGLAPKRKTHWQYLGAIKTQYLRRPDEP